MADEVHYLTWRENRKTRVACDPPDAEPVSDGMPRPGAGKTDAHRGRTHMRADGKRWVIDEEFVTCTACKETDEYKRSAAYSPHVAGQPKA